MPELATVTNNFDLRCLGIDFSGNSRMWSAGCRNSNVWIADVELGRGPACPHPVLIGLCRVQQLAGDEPPFVRLVQYLRTSDFDAAAIDAPFSIPAEYWTPQSHKDLLNLVSQNGEHKPFLPAHEFVRRALRGKVLSKTKPLRCTEEYWRQRGINVRSTLWAGPRGGAAMTAACLQLLSDANRPIWPWHGSGRGLLIEAFPAAQLFHWGLKHQTYNRATEVELAVRRSLVSSLATRIELGNFQQILEASADALDSVICAFAAIAVTTGMIFEHPEYPLDEGRIAIYTDRRANVETSAEEGMT